MKQCENAEQQLSYLSDCSSEIVRKKAGSYYTPSDATDFFWREFFEHNRVSGKRECEQFWREHHFIEPAVGAGILVFGLLKRAVATGLPFEALSDLELSIIDVNERALHFVEEQFAWLGDRWNISFPRLRLVCADYRDCLLPVSPRVPIVFGNPPFVKNPAGSRWKNLFADFVERSLSLSGSNGKLHFILPLSIAFSRDYSALRNSMMESDKSIVLSNFDNIPDCLFPSGKPNSENTNKANSQRITILTVFPSRERRVASTKLHRWSKKDRGALLSSRPKYFDLSSIFLRDQIPRPENEAVLAYLERNTSGLRLGQLLTHGGAWQLHVASVARNFIGIREDGASAVHTLGCASERDFLTVLGIISSDLFLAYWRTIGDGFHVTKSNLMNFPIEDHIKEQIEGQSTQLRVMWGQRSAFAKYKKHPNGVSVSYDFGVVAPRLLGDQV
jgi:hypothetical protein